MNNLTNKEQEILSNYKNATLEFYKTFDIEFYLKQIKKLYGECENFEIKKIGGISTDYYRYQIIFKIKSNNYTVGLYTESIFIRNNDTYYYHNDYSEVENNMEILEHLDK